LARKITIERFNNTLRQRVARLVREALSFSKTRVNHIGAIKMFICHSLEQTFSSLSVSWWARPLYRTSPLGRCASPHPLTFCPGQHVHGRDTLAPCPSNAGRRGRTMSAAATIGTLFALDRGQTRGLEGEERPTRWYREWSYADGRYPQTPSGYDGGRLACPHTLVGNRSRAE
jgi:hypothetical protein